MQQLILCGDIGGTNSRLSIYEVEKDKSNKKLLLRTQYRNSGFSQFHLILQEFLGTSKISVTPVCACFAVAGPVMNNSAVLTNLGWKLDGIELEKLFLIKKVIIVNDFVANGYGILTLDESKECSLLQSGIVDKSQPIALVGAGTGLGECYLTPDENGKYTCFASEGGHADFAPSNDEEIKIFQYLSNKFAKDKPSRISVERIASGSGIAYIYEALCSMYPKEVNAELSQKIDSTSNNDRAAIIAMSTETDRLCQRSMEIFYRAYGSEVGVVGLKFLPYGGLYLTGGITLKNQAILQKDGIFIRAITEKGRLSKAVKRINIKIVLIDDLGERGGQHVCIQYLEGIAENEREKEIVPQIVKPDFEQSYWMKICVTASIGISLMMLQLSLRAGRKI